MNIRRLVAVAAVVAAHAAVGCSGGEDGVPPEVDSLPATAAVDLPCEIRTGACSEFIGNGSGSIWIDGSRKPAGYYTGKTLCIKPGTYTGIGLYKLVATAAQPAIITNCGGQAVFNSASGSPWYVGGASRYLRITGTGSSAHVYGLVAGPSGGNQAHVDLREGTSDVEVDHLEVRGDGKGGVGIAFRTYPTCTGTYRRGTWAQYNTKIHDTYVHDTLYEGMYIGPSHYGWKNANSYTPGFDCGASGRWEEADVIGVEVTNNRVENTGNDGIQVGGAVQGMTVFRNVVKNYGLNANGSHSGGIYVNPGSKGVVDSNWIETTQPRQTQGIAFAGLGGSVVKNNVIVGARTGTMFLRSSEPNLDLPYTNVAYYHNTVVGSTAEGLYLFCNNMGKNSLPFANNLVVGTATSIGANGNDTNCIQSPRGPNLLSANTSAAGFVDAAAKNYHLLPTSSAVGTGTSLVGTVDVDYDGVDRTGRAYDLGAFALTP